MDKIELWCSVKLTMLLGQAGSLFMLWVQCVLDHVTGADRQSPVNYLHGHCSMTDHIIGADGQSPVNYLRRHCSVTLTTSSEQTDSLLWITCVVTAAWLTTSLGQTVSCELPALSLQCDWPHHWGRQSPVNYLCSHCSMIDHIIGADRQSPVNYLRCHCSVTDHIIGADSLLWITCVVTAVWLTTSLGQTVSCELPV